MKHLVEPLEITNSNRDWVLSEFQHLYAEWNAWALEVAKIVDQPYDHNTQLEVYADGEDNMHRHMVLQAKTLTFLNNNMKGHGFITGFEGDRSDSKTQRLKFRVKHRLRDLDILEASLQYAKVPEAFWKAKGKELVERLSKKTGEAAITIAASYLKNPFAENKE